jgi:hypothetical protein
MLQFFGQLMKLPMEALVYSMEMFVKTMRGLQHMASQGIDMVADGVVQPLVNALGAQSDACPEVTDGASRESAAVAQPITQKEEWKMADRDLRDDQLKLVRYKVLFVKRDLEYAFREQEELVHENIDAADYTGWKIAEFIQNLHNLEIPSKWQDKKYPRDVQGEPDPKIYSLPEDDKKYLRVYYEVLDRYTRERFRYEERQIEVLEDIRDRLPDRGRASEQRGGETSGGGTAAGGGGQPWRGR